MYRIRQKIAVCITNFLINFIAPFPRGAVPVPRGAVRRSHGRYGDQAGS